MKNLSKVFNPKVIIALLSILFFFCTVRVIVDYVRNTAPGYKYDLVSYRSEINIKSDNVYDVMDTFTLNFSDANVTTIYNIPLRDGDNKFNLLNIDISDNIEYDVKKTKDNYRLAFHNKYNLGSQEVMIRYAIDKGDDYDDERDYINQKLFNLETDYIPLDFEFNITYPSTVKSKGNILLNDDNVNDLFDLKRSDGYVHGKLNSTSGINGTLIFEENLTQGYFKDLSDYKMQNGAMIVLYIFITLVFFILWFLKGKDDRIISNPVFLPPNGMNPLEIGYWDNQDIEYNEIFNLILYWANNGYIKIKKNSANTKIDAFAKAYIGDYTFIKVRELDINAPEYEKMMYKAFFELGNEEKPGDFSVMEFLKETSNLFGTLQTYAQDLYEAEESFKEENRKSEKEGYDKGADMLFNAMKVITFALWGVAIFYYSELSFGTFANFLPIILVLITAFFGIFLQKDTFYGYAVVALPVLLFMSITTINPVVLVLLMIITILTASVRKRTFEYNELLGKIKGFTNVIKESRYNAEINSMVAQDPMYFYSIMPYALTLKVEKEWIKKFQIIPSPDWFESFDGIGLNTSNIAEFIGDMKELCMAILLNVNNSATSDKKEKSVEGIEYVAKKHDDIDDDKNDKL